MSRLPISLIILGALAALLALQAFPITGVFLMMLGAPMIAGLLVHAFLFSLLVEGLSGRVWRGVIAIPLVAYGGYYAMYAGQGLEIARKSAEMRASNPAKVLDFDPNLHSLVIADANALISGHQIPVAYEAKGDVLPERHLAHRLITRAQCAIPRDSQARVITSGARVQGVSQERVCLLRFPEAPPHKIVQAIQRGDSEIWKQKPQIMEQTTDILLDGAVIGSYRTASVWRLPAVPIMYVGCGLISSEPAWKCFADFMRSLVTIDAVPDRVDRAKYDTPAGVMLALRKYTAADFANFQGFPQNAPALTRAAEEPLRVENDVFAVLQKILDGQDLQPPDNMEYSISLKPERLAPFAGAMVKRFAELVAAERTRPNREVIADALAAGIGALPRAAYATVADQVFDLVHLPLVAERYKVLYLRAADAGPRTFEFYKSAIMASQQNRVMLPVLALAICRIGRADAETIAEFKRRFLGEYQDLGIKPALFVTLIKLGEEQFVRENLKMLQPRLAGWANAVLAGEGTTETGPSNCMVEDWGYTSSLAPEMKPGLEYIGHKGWTRRAATQSR